MRRRQILRACVAKESRPRAVEAVPGLTNYRRVPEDLVRAVPMGEGDIANGEFLRGLRAGGYDGPVAYEMCSPVRGGGGAENLDRCARRFLEWLAKHGLD